MNLQPQSAHASSRWLDLSQALNRRAFLLSAIGCVIGLCAAGVSLFEAKGTTTMFVPADAIAIVNQQPISRIDYAVQLRALGFDPVQAPLEDRRKVAEDMIAEELFVQRGKELDVAAVDPDVRNAMVRAVEAQAAANALTMAPEESQLQAHYNQNRSSYASEGSMTVLDLVFPVEVAAQARAALQAEKDIPAVLARFGGKNTGRLDGEEFYFAAKIHLGDDLFAAARRLHKGDISAPIAAADGAHLLVMIDDKPPLPMDFATAKTRVISDFQASAVARYQKAEAAFLRRRANVLLATDLR